MLGIELARHLRRTRPQDELLLLDVPAAVAPPDDLADVLVLRGDIRDAELLSAALDSPEVAVVHLASIVSGGAERDFDLALDVNLDGGRALVQACRAHGSGAAARVHELARDVRRRARARHRRRRHAPDAADDLRRDEGHARAAVRRRDPQGLPRRPLRAAADGDRAARRPERGGLELRQRRRARAARRAPDDAAGRPRPAGGRDRRRHDRRMPRAPARDRRRRARRRPRAQPPGPRRHAAASCWTRCTRSWTRRRSRPSRSRSIRPPRPSCAPGRRTGARRGPTPSACRATRTPPASCAPTSTRIGR